jgi:hypothetical protein
MFRSYRRDKPATAAAPAGVAAKRFSLVRGAHACYHLPDLPQTQGISRERSMKNPLDSIWGTIISGLVLTVVLVVIAKTLLA